MSSHSRKKVCVFCSSWVLCIATKKIACHKLVNFFPEVTQVERTRVIFKNHSDNETQNYDLKIWANPDLFDLSGKLTLSWCTINVLKIDIIWLVHHSVDSIDVYTTSYLQLVILYTSTFKLYQIILYFDSNYLDKIVIKHKWSWYFHLKIEYVRNNLIIVIVNPLTLLNSLQMSRVTKALPIHSKYLFISELIVKKQKQKRWMSQNDVSTTRSWRTSVNAYFSFKIYRSYKLYHNFLRLNHLMMTPAMMYGYACIRARTF